MAKFSTERELAFWLQGYFEIHNRMDLSPDQALTILRAANNVDKTKRGELTDFISNTLLTEKDLTKAGHALFKKLNQTFIHEIDPTIPGNQEQNRRTHNGDKPLPPGVQAMC